MNKTFEEDLDKLRTRLIRMGSLVEEQVEFAIRAIHENNVELAHIVVERDDKVDKLDLKIDKLCQRIFALNQPVASDLRLILAAIKINNELERIGDIATVIADVVINTPDTASLAKQIEVEQLSQPALKMLTASLDAFINNDPELADHILPSDVRVDEAYEALQVRLVSLMKTDSALVQSGSQLLLVLYHLERLADHATNIAENVIFLVRAKLVRHRSINTDMDDAPPQDIPANEGETQ